MEISFPHAKVGKDSEGIFIESKLGDKVERIYLNEIFEDYIQKEIDFSISTPEKEANGLFTGPHPLFPDDVETAKNVMEILDLRKSYHPTRVDLNVLNWLTKYYLENPPKMQFQKKYHDGIMFSKWQSELKEKTKELLHLPQEKCDLNPEIGPSAEFKGVKLTKVYFQSQPGLKVPAILAHPLALKRLTPAIICLHGHNTGKIAATGFDYSSSHSYYGLELAQRGYITLTLDQWGWGERLGSYKNQFRSNAEPMYALTSLLMGLNAVGIRTWDVVRAIDFLETIEFVQKNNFGVIGQSGGGTTSLFSCVVEERIQAAVISGYFCTLYDSIFTLHHCACNFIPDILRWADLPDILGTRAPKPTFIVSGEKDGIFPKQGVLKGYQQLQQIYTAANASENLDIDVWADHGHEFTGRKAYPWLDKHLHL